MINYPAVFHKEKDSYWAEFPDLPGCFSQGNSIEETFDMCFEALGLYLDKENDVYDRQINKPSSVKAIAKKYPKEIVMLIPFDSLEYAKKYKNKAVKKTLSIPEWLNDKAIRLDINFSQVLQEALINKLKEQGILKD
ncbi:MAG: type II toxin-antitoxin system HicB family antitoxin [Firmicutes bacterium]|nr:type II toxin-antitoxin system HicB family antitoxin [Candidatus Colivicinus equi]